MDSERALSTLISLAFEAGREVMDVYGSAVFGETLKSDSSPVTEADLRGEAVILRGLAEAFGSIPVVAEEEAAAGRVPETGASLVFLVDALDGTREFIARNGEFTVNIALVEGSAPLLGVVYAPALGELFAGGPGGAFRLVEGKGPRQPIRARPAAEPPVAVVSRSRAVTDETRTRLSAFGVEQISPCGSSLKFCRLATGEADLYPCLGPTMEWDTAAGQAVLEAAGGCVLDLDGRSVRYNKRGRSAERDFANGPFLAFGDPALSLLSAQNSAAS